MKGNVTRKIILFSFILIPVICSAILSLNLSVSAAAPNNHYIVGGTIIPTNNLLGPWVALIAVLALIVVAVHWKGKNITNV